MSGSIPEFLFHQGTNTFSYDYLGCNLTKKGRKFIYSFRVWAPNADSVSLVSDFSDWRDGIPMQRSMSGVWELLFESKVSLENSAYKYKITRGESSVYKGDPYARFSKGLDDGASLIYCEDKYRWKDKQYLKHRKNKFSHDLNLSWPINVYEVHLGSFLKKDDGAYLSYRELADVLPEYVKSMGFTHVELLPITEFPYDGSWGYQVCGFFAPTSRYGSPSDFKYLVDSFHKLGIGVILDWVPAHFPKDSWGLFEFDGGPLYEYQGKDRIESASWGTRFFDLGREEVQSFLISSALYFLRNFHIDGIRVDAVASMLYLDYDRSPGEWVPNVYGENISLEGVAFFQKLNSYIQDEFPDCLIIAEESGDYGKITKPIRDGGLGFSLKWNMGWANDFYHYLSIDPVGRAFNHKALNFPLMYAFSERYVMPISHDEVVHGKKSFIDKMYGSYEDKFAEMRAALLLMMTYPGKKMMFMGTEFAQFREWDYESMLEWFMLDYPYHKSMHEYVRALNEFYLKHSELWTYDFEEAGFKWILADDAEKNVVAYKRINASGDELIVVINFSGVQQSVKIPSDGVGFKIEFATNFREGDELINSLDNAANIRVDAFSGLVLSNRYNRIKIKI